MVLEDAGRPTILTILLLAIVGLMLRGHTFASSAGSGGAEPA
jgi:hypothetical protein